MPNQRKDQKQDISFRFLPLTVSLETRGGIATPLVLRGSPLPAVRIQNFSTVEDNQSAVTIRLSMGERPMFKDNVQLVEVELSEIPPQSRGAPVIEVRVEVSDECQVSMTAFEKTSGRKLQAKSNSTSFSLTQDEVQRLLDLAETHRDTDQRALRESEQRSKTDDLIARAEERLRTQGSSEDVSRGLADLGLALQAEDFEKVKRAANSLEALLVKTAPFPDIFGEIFRPRPAVLHADDASNAKSDNTSQATSRVKLESDSPTTTETLIADLPRASFKAGAIFGGGEFTLDPTLCFVLMPFGEELQAVYDDHVKQVIEGESLACVRADDIVGTRQITIDIWENVNRARFLLADLTGQNANVFYELGLAHALGKDVILLTQSMDHVPFDLKGVRCLVYEYTPPGMRNLEQKLRRTVRELMASDLPS